MFKTIEEKVYGYIMKLKEAVKQVPAVAFGLLVGCIITMNLLANKLILDLPWIALDAGILVSWFCFLLCDIMVKAYGPKTAFRVSIVASFCNLVFSILMMIAGFIGGTWAGEYSPLVDSVISGTIRALIASTAAFVISSFVDSFSNWVIFKRFKDKRSFRSYIVSSGVSTFIGQFVDNFVFAMLFTVALGWISVGAALMMSLTGAVAELICQLLFSNLGYKVSEKWIQESGNKSEVV